MSLNKFKKPVPEHKGVKYIIYGEKGLGKTTLALKFPSPVLIDAENGSTYANANGSALSLEVNSYEDFCSVYKELKSMRHPYKTLIIDTIDWFEDLICAYARKLLPKVKENDAKELWSKAKEITTEFLINLDVLTNLGMNIVLTAHQGTYKVDDPVVENGYTRACLSVSRWTAGKYMDFADNIMYMHIDIQNVVDKRAVLASKDSNEIIALEVGTSPCYEAKARVPNVPATTNPRKDDIVSIFGAITTHMDDDKVRFIESHYGEGLSSFIETLSSRGYILNDSLHTMSNIVFKELEKKINGKQTDRES